MSEQQSDTLAQLLEAQHKAERLFDECRSRGFIVAGQTEQQLSDRIFALAAEMFNARRHWHKRIVRSGPHTLLPYAEVPPDRVIADDDILFLDFGPVFEGWEADLGRTYVLGDDPDKLRLMRDVEAAWNEGQRHFREHPQLTCAQMFAFVSDVAQRMGWVYGGPHCGHLVGQFPHERILGDEAANYLRPDNADPMRQPDARGGVRRWILEIHFVDRNRRIGGFFEQLLLP